MTLWLLMACAPQAPEVELGRWLFYEPALSADGQTSCASCHEQARAFTDGRALPVGAHGTQGVRNAQSIANSDAYSTLTWSNPALATLEQQIQVPLFSEDPLEIGLVTDALVELSVLAPYPELLKDAGYDTLAPSMLPRVLAAFVEDLSSSASPWDAHQAGRDVLSPEAQLGEAHFHRLGCASCHPPPHFTIAATDHPDPFFNTGLYDLGDGAYPRHGEGLFEITGAATDMGRFRPPSLRDVAQTAPYMHDGSAPDLSSVLRDYARGGRLTTDGTRAGDGRDNPYKDPRIRGFPMDDPMENALLAFLSSLSDPNLLTRERWSDPR